MNDVVEPPPHYSLPKTALWFSAGGIVTAAFSGSLARLATNADIDEVLGLGMLVPCFTWVVQLSASGLAMPFVSRRFYWGDLGRVCLWGSAALLPGALVNLLLPNPPLWASAVNVLLSVGIMATILFRRSAMHGLSRWWPISTTALD